MVETLVLSANASMVWLKFDDDYSHACNMPECKHPYHAEVLKDAIRYHPKRA